MPDVKISQLPAGTANANAVVPATNAAGTTTEKVTMGSIRDLTHASRHQTGGADQILPVVVTNSIATSQNNYAPAVCDILRVSSSIAVDITGMAAATVDGAIRLIINTNASGGANITLKHESASSDAANRFRSVTTADVVLLPDGGSVTLTYSTAISRWRIL